MRSNLVPIGLAIHNEDKENKFSESWSYHIVTERLITCKHGTISEINVHDIEKGLDRIIEEFTNLKKYFLY